MKKILFFFLLFVQFLFTPSSVSAVNAPQFVGCENVSGTPSVSYSQGIHGVAGDTTTYTGSDEVYYLNSEQVVQCLCSDTAGGIQSNWWKVVDISFEEIQLFTRTGWVYIPNGSAWGLENSPYLVENKKFHCSARGGGTSSNSNGQVLGASVLAATGTQTILFSILVIGLILLLVSKKNRHKNS